MLQKGFTLIELMIVVAIIGILSMFALPAYQDYTKRTYVAEGIALASGAKLAATEYFSTNGEWPSKNEQAGLPESKLIAGQSVTGIALSGGGANASSIINIYYNSKVIAGGGTAAPAADAQGALAKGVLQLHATSFASGGSIKWECLGTKDGTKLKTSEIEMKWLPANCRDEITT